MTGAAILAGARGTGVREYRAQLARVAGCTLTEEAAHCCGYARGPVLAGSRGAGADCHPRGCQGPQGWEGSTTARQTAQRSYAGTTIARGAETLHNAYRIVQNLYSTAEWYADANKLLKNCSNSIPLNILSGVYILCLGMK